jgi:beta-glucosidase
VLLQAAGGGTAHDFKGRLGFSWPRRADQYINNVGQPGYSPQFAFGHGLGYGDDGNLAKLSEEPGVSAAMGRPGVYYARGVLTPGIQMQMQGASGAAVNVAALPAALPDGSVRVRAVDHLAQEDARRIEWSGPGQATVSLHSAAAKELTRETNGDVMLVLTVRVDAPVKGEVSVGVGCGPGCGAKLPLTDTLAGLEPGRWTTLGIPLKCFAAAGADTSKLDTLLSLQAKGPAQLSLSKVALGAQGDAQKVMACATK